MFARIPRPRWSLRRKLIFWSLAPTVLIVATGLVAFAAYGRATESLAVERSRDLTRLLADQLSLELRASVRLLEDCSRDLRTYADDPACQTDVLRQAAGRLLVFDAGVVLLDADGVVVATQPEQPQWLGQDWSDRIWAQSSLAGFSDVVTDGPGGRDVAVLAVPVNDIGENHAGTLAGMFYVPPAASSSLYGGIRRGVGRAVPAEELLVVRDDGRVEPASEGSALSRLLSGSTGVSTGLTGDGSAYLVDSAGQTVYHSDGRQAGRDASGSAIVGAALDGGVGAVRTRSAQGQEVIASYAPVQGTPWRLVREESWEARMAESGRYRGILLGLLALGVLAPVLVVNLAMGRITQPVRQMLEAAREVVGGRASRTVHAHTGDELEDLAEQFNAMSAQIEDSYSGLEQRVAQRTRDLATLNALAFVTSRSLDLKDVLEGALARTVDALYADAGLACSLDVESGESAALVCQGFAGENPTAGGLETWPVEAPLAAPAEEAPPALQEALARGGVRTVVWVPVMCNQRRVGGMLLASRAERTLTDEETSLLSAIGQQVGLAVENARLHAQAQRLAVMEERNRLARELHDSIAQSLYAMGLYARAAGRMLADGQQQTAAEHMQVLGDTAQSALREMRLLVFDLRSPQLQDGLAAALQARLDAVEGRAGLMACLRVTGEAALPADTEQALYRLAWEALNNTLKHARARTVTVTLQLAEERTVLVVEDDGQGFDPAHLHAGGLGMDSMRERAAAIGGRLCIESAVGRGTRIRVEVARG
ncbi:MAG: histidine kinase [Anaerolineae bacterium]